jgi:hypothetical protein
MLIFQAFCPVRELPRQRTHEDPLDNLHIKDKVRGKVVVNSSLLHWLSVMFFQWQNEWQCMWHKLHMGICRVQFTILHYTTEW